MRFGSDATAFGCPGAGGCFGMADPKQQLSFAYVTNKMGFHLFDDPTRVRLPRSVLRQPRGSGKQEAGSVIYFSCSSSGFFSRMNVRCS